MAHQYCHSPRRRGIQKNKQIQPCFGSSAFAEDDDVLVGDDVLVDDDVLVGDDVLVDDDVFVTIYILEKIYIYFD